MPPPFLTVHAVRLPFVVLSTLVTFSVGLVAQGATAYFNVESPQVKPITVATLNGHDYLLVCNTPDNAVEVYDTVGNVLLASVRTGAEPISVTWDATTSRFFTADFLGDSVTAVDLVPQGSNPPLPRLRRTEWVGDEPGHVGVLPGGLLAVSLGSMSQLALIDQNTLQPVFGAALDLLDDFANPRRALKEPRTVMTAGPLVAVLNHKGGKAGISFGAAYDFDVWWVNLASGGVGTLGNLGTTNFNLQLANNGDAFVVGTDADLALVGEAAARTAPTGFTRTVLYRVRGLGGASPQTLARDLNRQTTSGSLGNPVTPQEALAQVTDVAVFEPDTNTQKLYLTAFNSDRVGVVDARGSQPNAWPILARIAISPIGAIPNAMAGPRALAVKYARPGVSGDPGARVYVLNRLDHSVTVIDPLTDAVVTTFALRFDPTPLHIRVGRKFLYDARLSGNGFVSCASCHQDGRSDFLMWDLSDYVAVPFDPALNGGISAPPSNPTWPGNKGRLVTQSLQGMLNTEVEARTQAFVTNEPLHWRADRRTFADFNGAFVNLLGGALLSPAEMAAFRGFVMSVHYPPNPEQDLTRRPRGAFGTPTSTSDGSGALRGLKLSTIRALTSLSPGGTLAAGRSCIQCHEPPEGSENLVTMFDTSSSTPSILQPLETTQVRMTRHKERRFEKGPLGLSAIQTGMFGIGHEGGLDSINDFTSGAFGRSFPGNGEVEDVIQLFREWDSGIGPLAGRPFSVDVNNRALAPALLGFYTAQAAQANSGIAVHGRIGGQARGFWFDLTGSAGVYREEPSQAAFGQAALLALLTTSDDVLVFEATPLGSERRMAHLLPSAPSPQIGPPPANITLEPMPASPFWREMPQLTLNWDISGPSPFVWRATSQPEPAILRKKRIAQKGLVNDGGGLNLGIAGPRYEAPRRIAVAGDNIRHGANVVILIPLDPNSPPPPAIQGPFTWLWLPIHPTERRNGAGKRIWETHVELDPMTAYTLMLGGHAAPSVYALLGGALTLEPPAPGTFNPSGWNRYWVAVLNADGTLALTFGERVRMQ